MYQLKFFFGHKSVNQPQSWSKLQFFFFLIQDFYSLIAKFINYVTDFAEKIHKITYFQYKKWLWTGYFCTFITVLGMSKISNNIGFDAFLSFGKISKHFPKICVKIRCVTKNHSICWNTEKVVAKWTLNSTP